MNTKIQKEIARRNKLFAGKTPSQQRVLIAKDIIQLLKMGKLRATSDYLNHPVRRYNRAKEGKPAQIELLTTKEPCACCAKGAIFVSYIMNKNEITIGWDFEAAFQRVKENTFATGISHIFPPEMLREIENHYEGFYYKATFVHKYPEKTKRLGAIMNNIIKNKGEFIP